MQVASIKTHVLKAPLVSALEAIYDEPLSNFAFHKCNLRHYITEAKNKGDKYFLDYTVERPSEEFYQHLVSSVGVGFNGRVARLFTITAVCPEGQWAAQQDTLKQILDTFEIPPTRF